MKKTIIFLLLVFLINVPVRASSSYGIITLKGSVNPISSDYISKSIEQANKDKLAFIVIEMDTPGGLVSSTREIIQSMMKSKIPIIVYVYPKGAQAASAGGFIMLAAHIAVMSPGTEIGAMHPVGIVPFDINKSGDSNSNNSDSKIMRLKIVNDLVAFARSLAEQRGRNIKWTEDAIRNAVSSTNQEALKLGVIDFIANDMDDLLLKLNGRKVKVDDGEIVISTKGLVALNYEMRLKEKFFNFFANPEIMFLLFIVAIAGIGFEIKNPGMVFPAVLGGIALFLFLISSRIIPVNIAGLLLILTGIILFVLELNFTSYGLLTTGGLAAFIAGALILFDSPDSVLPGMRIPWSTIIATVVVLIAFIYIVVRAVLKALKAGVVTGQQGMIGECGEIITFDAGKGKGSIHGEIWNVISMDDLKPNDRFSVIEINGMILKIKKEI